MHPKTASEALSQVIGELNITRRMLEFIIDSLGGDGSPKYVGVGQVLTDVRRLVWDVQLLKTEFADHEATPRATAVVAPSAPSGPLATTLLNPPPIVAELQRRLAIAEAEIMVLEGKLEGRLR